MSELYAWLGISVALFCVCILVKFFMLCDEISDLSYKISELRTDSKQGEDDGNI